ncbi:MAG TPA: hypothetical protein VHP30_01525, partial [Ignavibacteriales bacterium]|nr:hypothetical protein [Ignavibacteriales bacterium]
YKILTGAQSRKYFSVSAFPDAADCLIPAGRLLLIAMSLFLLHGLTAYGAGDTCIVAESGFSYSLAAPAGWVCDTVSGQDQGMPVVFYRNGENWSDASVVMYAASSEENEENGRNIGELIKNEIKKFSDAYPDLEIKKNDRPIPGRKDTVTLRNFISRSSDIYESVAYFEKDGTVVMLVLSCTSAGDFTACNNIFANLVNSFTVLDE